jgi:hypothetical protein
MAYQAAFGCSCAKGPARYHPAGAAAESYACVRQSIEAGNLEKTRCQPCGRSSAVRLQAVSGACQLFSTSADWSGVLSFVPKKSDLLPEMKLMLLRWV